MDMDAIATLSYEEAFGKLEKSVAALQDGRLSLEQALECYEEGMKLAQHCHDLLQNAEMQMQDLLNNRILVAALLGWAVAQISKTVYECIRYRELKLGRLVSSGGMPSSHSALVTGLATATGRITGLGSPMFAVAAVLAGIVMYDAAGVRRAVSIQARILNQMID